MKILILLALISISANAMEQDVAIRDAVRLTKDHDSIFVSEPMLARALDRDPLTAHERSGGTDGGTGTK